ncbi:hypothetical protein ACJX0J_040953, partial [Zea mays]
VLILMQFPSVGCLNCAINTDAHLNIDYVYIPFINDHGWHPRAAMLPNSGEPFFTIYHQAAAMFTMEDAQQPLSKRKKDKKQAGLIVDVTQASQALLVTPIC